MEQCARFLHQPNTPWVAPEDFSALDMMETNLVGQAAEGILFLREVGEMTRAQQKNLLNQTLKLESYHTRILSSSSLHLAERGAKGEFEPRLYALLSGAFERVYFEYHLSREGGNMSRVAERVGLERTRLYRKLKQLGIKLTRRADE